MAIHEKLGMSDEWYTPKYIFDSLGTTFDLDVASPTDRTNCNVPARQFITENSLTKDWNGFVWMNPPFGGRNAIRTWLEKLIKHGNGIALTPDRSSTEWWQFAAKYSDCLLQVQGKIKFIKPDGSTGDSPANGTTLFGFGKDACAALMAAQEKGLGILLLKI